jgi:hypothetical protein
VNRTPAVISLGVMENIHIFELSYKPPTFCFWNFA